MTIHTAIIGYGTGGRVFHAPLIDATEGLSVAAVVTSDPAKAADVRARYTGADVFESVDELFTAGGFDLLVVTSPNATHVPYARRAVEAGVPVVLDKPLATSADEARELVTAADDAGVPLTVFQNRRWDGDFLTVQELIEQGAIGEVRQFDSSFEWWAPDLGERWKDTATPAEGGGILFDLGPHLIDQALALFGEVTGVHAELDNRRGGGADDDAFLSLTHESGVRSRLWMSAIAPANRLRFRVVGSTGVIESQGLDPQEEQSIAGLSPLDERFGLHDDDRALLIRRPDGVDEQVPLRAGRHLSFYEQVALALTNRAELPVAPRDSIRGLAIIQEGMGW